MLVNQKKKPEEVRFGTVRLTGYIVKIKACMKEPSEAAYYALVDPDCQLDEKHSMLALFAGV